MNGRHGGDEGEPEPEEDVDLLVDDVEREDAEAVELLLAGSRAHAVERAAETGLSKFSLSLLFFFFRLANANLLDKKFNSYTTSKTLYGSLVG